MNVTNGYIVRVTRRRWRVQFARREVVCVATERQESGPVGVEFEAATGVMTPGTVSHAQTLRGWFVLMKDSKNSHPDNKLWGSGWGGSWFDAANPSKTTSTDYKPDCLPCHKPARASDGIYVQGYPALSNDYQACQGKPPSETFRLETKGTHVA